MVVLCLVLSALAAGAQTVSLQPADLGWKALGEGVSQEKGRAEQGPPCLALTKVGEKDAWAVSEPLAGFEPGKLVELSLSLRRASGSGELALSLVSDPAVRPLPAAVPPSPAALPATPALWQGVPAADTRWHRLSLQLVCGMDKPRLLAGAVGAPAAWLVDEVRVAPARALAVTKPAKEAGPRYAESLPAGWRPEGHLDVRTRPGTGPGRAYIQVGALELHPPTEVTVLRGQRSGVEVDAISWVDAAEALEVEVLGPPGWRNERRKVTVAAKASKPIRVPLQALTTGDFEVALRFSSARETARSPLLVHVLPYAPAFGALWEGAFPVAGDLSGPGAAALQFQQVTAAAGADLRPLAALGADLVLTWRGTAQEAAAALAGLPAAARVAQVGAEGGEPGPAGWAPEAYLARALHAAGRDVLVMSRTFDLESGPAGLEPGSAGRARGPDLARALDQGLGAAADVLTVRLPPLPGAGLVRESVDGAAPSDAPMTAWTHFDRAWSLAGVRGLLRAKQAELPLFASGVGGRSTGDPALDALLLSRVILQVVSMGANGVTVPAQRLSVAQAQAYSELTRELAGVRSLGPPPDTDLAGYAPGKPVTYRPFLRGNEGIIALWNNTARPQQVAVEVRLRPLETRLLRISYPGEVCRREYVPEFDWDATAKYQRQSAVYVELQPLQVAVLAIEFRAAHAAWLREVGPKPAGPPSEAPPLERKPWDGDLWGRPQD